MGLQLFYCIDSHIIIALPNIWIAIFDTLSRSLWRLHIDRKLLDRDYYRKRNKGKKQRTNKLNN